MRASTLRAAGLAAFSLSCVHVDPCLADAAPSIDTADVTEQVLQPFSRPLPLGTFSGSRVVDLALSDAAKPPPPDVELHIGPLRVRDTRVQLQGPKLTAKLGVAGAGVVPLDIEVSDLEQAGSFDLPIQIYQPGSTVQRFVVHLTAGDAVWVPLLAILVGVLLSSLLRHLSDRYEPRQRLLARLEDVRGDIQRFIDLSDVARRVRLQRMRARLDLIQVKSETDDLATLGVSLDGIEADVEEFRTDWGARAEGLARSIDAGRAELRKEHNSFNPRPTDGEVVALDILGEKLLAVEEALQREAVDEAEQKRKDWNADFQDLRLARKRRLLAALVGMMVGQGQAARGESDALRTRAEAQLEAGDVDGAGATLKDLSDLLHRDREVVHEAVQEAAGDARAQRADADPRVDAPKVFVTRAGDARRRAGRARLVLGGISVVLAVLSGLAALYFGKPFGSVTDYLLAATWGFGSDNAVQNADSLIKKLRGGAA